MGFIYEPKEQEEYGIGKKELMQGIDEFYRTFFPLQEKIYESRCSNKLSATEKGNLIDKIITVLLEYYPLLSSILNEDELSQKQTWIISKVEEFNKMKADFGQKPVEPAEIEKDISLSLCDINVLVNVYHFIYQGKEFPQSESLARILAYNARKVILIKQEELAKKQKEEATKKPQDCADQFETVYEDQFWNPDSTLEHSQTKTKEVSDRYWLRFPQLEEEIYEKKDVNKIGEALDLMTQYYPLLPFLFQGAELASKRSQIIEKMMEFARVRARITGTEDITKRVSHDDTEKSPEEYENKIVDAMNTYRDLGPGTTEQKDSLLVNIFNAYTNKPKEKFGSDYEAPEGKEGCNDVHETYFPDQFFGEERVPQHKQ